jgi:hypothetical protein
MRIQWEEKLPVVSCQLPVKKRARQTNLSYWQLTTGNWQLTAGIVSALRLEQTTPTGNSAV